MMAVLINPNPVVHFRREEEAPSMDIDGGLIKASEIFDYIRDIKDPEHPYTLEQLKVIEPEKIWVTDLPNTCYIKIEFTPTVPHCSLATLIGLCLRRKLSSVISKPFKLDIYVTKGKHSTEAEINKQVNDKERVAAALENPNLLSIVQGCIGEES